MLKVSKETLQEAVDRLRAIYLDSIANLIQFGKEGRDEGDGHRCNFCEKLAGGDSKHRCW